MSASGLREHIVIQVPDHCAFDKRIGQQQHTEFAGESVLFAQVDGLGPFATTGDGRFNFGAQ